MEKVEEETLKEIVSLLKLILESNNKLYKIMSKYDSEYLTEVEKDAYLKEG